MAVTKRKLRSLDELCDAMSVKNDAANGYVVTGVIPFDLITAGKGLPLGTLMQFYSSSGFGKSTTMLTVCRSLADKGYKSLYAAVEPNQSLADSMGLSDDKYRDNFKMLSLTTYSEIEELTWAFLESEYTLLVIDSISACCVSTIAKGEVSIEDNMPAIDARIRSAYLKLFNGNIKGYNKTICYLNQTRANFNAGWGGQEFIAEGGYAGKFYSSIQFTMNGDAKVQDITAGGDAKKVIGKQGYLWSEKNRTASPFARIPIQVLFGKGVSNLYSLTAYLYWKGAVAAAGSVFKISWNGEAVSVKGRAGRAEWVKANAPAIAEDLYANAPAYYDALLEGFKAEF